MKPPKSDHEYEGCERDCMEAIQGHILRLLDEAQSVGWHPADVGAALMEFGDMLVRVDGRKLLEGFTREN
ncbi:hypothetical protein I6F26_03595 [Ensifer sp. IC3342]|nr:hypothetical protein [Ensifer sp. BRP08]MCA1445676.1 hypothetical protein [Ensifer sp. IC3342]